MSNAWAIITDQKFSAPLIAVGRQAGATVTAVVVGSRALAEAAAAGGADRVIWAETGPDVPVEALAASVAAAAAADGPDLLVASVAPAARVLLGAAAAARGAVMVGGVVKIEAAGDQLVIDRAGFGGALIESFRTGAPVAAIYSGDAAGDDTGQSAPIENLDAEVLSDIRLEATEPVGGGGGIRGAARVVGIGRGIKARADLELVQDLAVALGAEVGCSMPIADDLGWMEPERYIGRSGQTIAPRLYLAFGIAGAPQHMEGVRDAKVVAAINTDPAAMIFRGADYGIVGDLYEIIPALRAALGQA